jgi:hypothetical protein
MDRVIAYRVMIVIALVSLPSEHAMTAQVDGRDWKLEEWVGQTAFDGPAPSLRHDRHWSRHGFDWRGD